MKYGLSLLMLLTLFGCIKDDFVFDEVDPELKITSLVTGLPVDTIYQMTFLYLNNIGVAENISPEWSSSNSNIIEVDENGQLRTKSKGTAIVSIIFDNGIQTLSDSITIEVNDKTIIEEQSKSGTIQTTSSYLLEGDFTVTESEGKLIIEIAENYKASTSLPGLYVYLSNNRNEVSNGLEIGMVTVYSGSHFYELDNIGINDYRYIVYFCKPFNVKVGDGEIL